ncbi:aspartate/glutamate racemase family protein [Ramlibacter sp.]|uniref:aspartate/glutamate racemase family protein n=1 Tax=Ramlibacter sp. TaxID=1917967 RepID=UPI002BC7C9B2|nr:amino acid racemase [Ramlibacter sp.]HWI82975.1 amino acid racemase [Ramlibacter sp.]
MTNLPLPTPARRAAGARVSTRAVGILGGMGPAAGADFVRLFVQAWSELLQARGLPVTDQSFPEHWLVQLPVPDRSAALDAEIPGRDGPFLAMAAGLAKLQAVGVQAAAIACNTAHAWHAALRARCPAIELLHAPREVASLLRAAGVREAALLATQGTYRAGLYEAALAREGIACHLPDEAARQTLMRGIYAGVKAGDLPLAQAAFVEVGRGLLGRHGDIPLIMGCTEIPLGLAPAPEAARWDLVNPGRVLAQALARRAWVGCEDLDASPSHGALP